MVDSQSNEEFCVFNLSGAVTISEERKVCTGSEKFFKMCESNEVRGNVGTNVGETSRQTAGEKVKTQQK